MLSGDSHKPDVQARQRRYPTIGVRLRWNGVSAVPCAKLAHAPLGN